jgi:hypothetical protein
MTVYRDLCEDLWDTLGRDDALRRAYRVYLWRRALDLIRHSHSEVQAFPWSRRSNNLDAERARRS